MNDLEAALRQALHDDRDAFEASSGLPRRIKRRTAQRAARRRAGTAAIVFASVVAVAAGVPLAASISGDGATERPMALARWSATKTEPGPPPGAAIAETPTSRTSPDQPAPRRRDRDSTTKKTSRDRRESNGPASSGGTEPSKRAAGSGTPTTTSAQGGQGTGTSEPDVTTTTGVSQDASIGDGSAAAEIASGDTSANAAASGIIGPATVEVGQPVTYKAEGVDEFNWTPTEVGTFDVALEVPPGELCHKTVTVVPEGEAPVDPAADAAATDCEPPPAEANAAP